MNLPTTMLWNFQIMYLCISSRFHHHVWQSIDHSCHYILDHCLCSYRCTCSRVVYRHHPAEVLKTGKNTHTQKILKLRENDRKCNVEDEWLRNGRMFVFRATCELQARVFMEGQCYMYDTISGHDLWLSSLLNFKV